MCIQNKKPSYLLNNMHHIALQLEVLLYCCKLHYRLFTLYCILTCEWHANEHASKHKKGLLKGRSQINSQLSDFELDVYLCVKKTKVWRENHSHA